MENLKKRNIVILLFAIMIVAFVFLGVSLYKPEKAEAIEIDYVNQEYIVKPDNFYDAREDVVFKIHCPSLRGVVADEEVEEYVTIISFRAAMGCQIYFANGVACNLEDSEYRDHAWDYYSYFYEILHYDDVNKYVYFKFKNLSELDDHETVSGTVADIGIWIRRSSEYVKQPEYIFLSNIDKPETEIKETDIYFLDNAICATGASLQTNKSIYAMKFELAIKQEVFHLLDHAEFSIVEGGQYYSLKSEILYPENAGTREGYNYFSVWVLGDLIGITDDVKISAKVYYGENYVGAESNSVNILSLWNVLVKNNFSEGDYSLYMSNQSKEHIRRLIQAYSGTFYPEIKSIQNHFVPFSVSSDLKETSLVFRIPLVNCNSIHICWVSEYWQGKMYSVDIIANKSSGFYVSVEASATEVDESGVMDENSEIIKNESVAQAVYNSIEYFSYGDYLYLRINDNSAIDSYFPSKVGRTFSANAYDTSYSKMQIQTNTATVVYDEYNEQLIAQINSLNTQLSELQVLLDDANELSENQKILITSLQSSLDGIKIDYSNSQTELAYLKEQMEVMKAEYQAKIDELMAEKVEQEENSNDVVIEESESDEANKKAGAIVVLCGVVVLIILVVSLLIPKGRKR